MKKSLLLFVAFLAVVCFARAQSNAIIFTENGERFYAILNGLRQNDQPQTNVKVTGLNAEFFKLKIIFEDKRLGEKNFNLALEANMETTVMIKKNPKGEYVMRLVSAVPVAEAAKPRSGQQIVVYDPRAVPYTGTVTQTTTTTLEVPDGGVNMGVNMNVEGATIQMNVAGGATTTSSTTTTTTTTTHQHSKPDNNPPPVYLPGYSGVVGCPVPVGGGQFEEMKRSIESKSFEESKLAVARQIVNNNCLLSGQVKQILMLFSFEATRLDFAKYCYGYTYDIGNYYKINDAFTFESSIDELNDYIQSYQR